MEGGELLLGAHAVLEGAGGHVEAALVADVRDSSGADGVEFLVRSFCLDHERGRLGAHERAVAPGVADTDHLLGVAEKVEVTFLQIRELHRSECPVRLHAAERHAWPDVVVLHVATDHAVADEIEPILPGLSFPAVGRVGVHAQAGVVVADLHEVHEVRTADGACPAMDLVGEDNAEGRRVVADSLRLDHEALISLGDEIVVRAFREPPWVAGRDFPAPSRAPEHGYDLDVELGAEVE